MSAGSTAEGGIERGASAPVSAREIREFAHAVRNPLNGARLHLIFVERELARLGAGDDAVEAARVIGEEIDRIAELVRELVEAPARSSKPRSLVSLRSLCARAIELVSSQQAGVDVGSELPDPDLMLEVHCQEMEQVVFDLLHRALQGALGSGGRVLLRARRDVDSGQALIEIQHDGACSTPALSPAIDGNDSGSDFSVALSIVADHGGTIEVVTQPGQACFHVKLPLCRVDARAAETG